MAMGKKETVVSDLREIENCTDSALSVYPTEWEVSGIREAV
jgi:hypothetical protein